MPKMKTRSAAKKRFTKVGKRTIKRSKAFHRHLLTKKSRKTKRKLGASAYIHKSDVRSMLRLLPY